MLYLNTYRLPESPYVKNRHFINLLDIEKDKNIIKDTVYCFIKERFLNLNEFIKEYSNSGCVYFAIESLVHKETKEDIFLSIALLGNYREILYTGFNVGGTDQGVWADQLLVGTEITILGHALQVVLQVKDAPINGECFKAYRYLDVITEERRSKDLSNCKEYTVKYSIQDGFLIVG